MAHHRAACQLDVQSDSKPAVSAFFLLSSIVASSWVAGGLGARSTIICQYLLQVGWASASNNRRTQLTVYRSAIIPQKVLPAATPCLRLTWRNGLTGAPLNQPSANPQRNAVHVWRAIHAAAPGRRLAMTEGFAPTCGPGKPRRYRRVFSAEAHRPGPGDSADCPRPDRPLAASSAPSAHGSDHRRYRSHGQPRSASLTFSQRALHCAVGVKSTSRYENQAELTLTRVMAFTNAATGAGIQRR